MSARLAAIFVAPAAGAPVRRVARVEAVAGVGLAGDRYATGEGSFSRWPGPVREVSLIGAQALRDAAAEFGVRLGAGEHRRNLVVAGLDPAALLGRRFRIGAVEMEGLRRCAPCRYLVRVTGQARAFDALVRRGGLRARIAAGGTLREGDAVEDLGPAAQPRELPG